MQSAEALATTLTEFLKKSSSKLATGTQLAHLLRIADPHLQFANFGCTNLRDFLRRYAREVTEVGRAGADIIYGIADGSPASAQLPPRIDRESRFHPQPTRKRWDTQVWKTFANPSSHYKLYALRTSGEVRVLPPYSVGLPELCPVFEFASQRKIAPLLWQNGLQAVLAAWFRCGRLVGAEVSRAFRVRGERWSEINPSRCSDCA